MHTRGIFITAAIGIGTVLMLAAGAALADDRKPTLEERSRIEAQLKKAGYTSWDEIEFDERRKDWEVDDARAADGKFYDLRLHPQTLEVTTRKLDQ